MAGKRRHCIAAGMLVVLMRVLTTPARLVIVSVELQVVDVMVNPRHEDAGNRTPSLALGHCRTQVVCLFDSATGGENRGLLGLLVCRKLAGLVVPPERLQTLGRVYRHSALAI